MPKDCSSGRDKSTCKSSSSSTTGDIQITHNLGAQKREVQNTSSKEIPEHNVDKLKLGKGRTLSPNFKNISQTYPAMQLELLKPQHRHSGLTEEGNAE